MKREFIKWRPFNAVISNKDVLKELNNEQTQKPNLTEEELSILNELINDAYYSHNTIFITIYENNQIKEFKTKIIKLEPAFNLIYLSNHTPITFNNIIHIKDY